MVITVCTLSPIFFWVDVQKLLKYSPAEWVGNQLNNELVCRFAYSTSALTYNTPLPEISSSTISFPKKEQAIVLNAVDNLTLTSIVAPKDVIFASKLSNGGICIYLSNKALLDQVVTEFRLIIKKLKSEDLFHQRAELLSLTPARQYRTLSLKI